jgi:hypothetical protein
VLGVVTSLVVDDDVTNDVVDWVGLAVVVVALCSVVVVLL